jgi:uncharacterized integral membrane protein
MALAAPLPPPASRRATACPREDEPSTSLSVILRIPASKRLLRPIEVPPPDRSWCCHLTAVVVGSLIGLGDHGALAAGAAGDWREHPQQHPVTSARRAGAELGSPPDLRAQVKHVGAAVHVDLGQPVHGRHLRMTATPLAVPSVLGSVSYSRLLWANAGAGRGRRAVAFTRCGRGPIPRTVATISGEAARREGERRWPLLEVYRSVSGAGSLPGLMVALVVVALTLIFIVQNRDTVQIRLFAITLYSPL